MMDFRGYIHIRFTPSTMHVTGVNLIFKGFSSALVTIIQNATDRKSGGRFYLEQPIIEKSHNSTSHCQPHALSGKTIDSRCCTAHGLLTLRCRSPIVT